MSAADSISIPRLRYTVTWEEFVEIYKDSKPKPNWVSVTVTLCCAAIFIAFGVLLARAVDREDWQAVWFFWLLPVLLIGFVAWELTVQVVSKRRNQLKEIRSRFDRFYSKEQGFGCNHEKWIHETESTQQESQWSGLLTFADRREILTLSTKDYVAVVPKRVLSAHDLQVIREAVLGPEALTFSPTSSIWDWSRTTFAELWKHNIAVMLIVNAAVIGVLIWSVGRLGSPSNPTDFFWGKLLCVVVLIFGITAQFWYFPLRYAATGLREKSPTQVQVSARGVWFQLPDVDVFRGWKSFRKSQETACSFLLFYEGNRYFMIGKRGLTSEQVEGFRKLAQAHLRES